MKLRESFSPLSFQSFQDEQNVEQIFLLPSATRGLCTAICQYFNVRVHVILFFRALLLKHIEVQLFAH